MNMNTVSSTDINIIIKSQQLVATSGLGNGQGEKFF